MELILAEINGEEHNIKILIGYNKHQWIPHSNVDDIPETLQVEAQVEPKDEARKYMQPLQNLDHFLEEDAARSPGIKGGENHR